MPLPREQKPSCQIFPGKKRPPSQVPGFPSPRKRWISLLKSFLWCVWVEELGSASGPWSRQGFHVQCRWEEKASLPGAFGLRRYLVAPCSLIGQKCPGQACDPTAVEGLCPNTTCLPTHRLPRVLPAVHLGPGALLHPDRFQTLFLSPPVPPPCKKCQSPSRLHGPRKDSGERPHPGSRSYQTAWPEWS